jgi:hypothetical protein
MGCWTIFNPQTSEPRNFRFGVITLPHDSLTLQFLLIYSLLGLESGFAVMKTLSLLSVCLSVEEILAVRSRREDKMEGVEEQKLWSRQTKSRREGRIFETTPGRFWL